MANFDQVDVGSVSADGQAGAVDVQGVANGLALLLSGIFIADIQIQVSFDGSTFVNFEAVKTVPGHFPIPPCHSVDLAVSSYTAAQATGTLTGTANFGDTETVTIGTKVYTFQTVLTDVDGNVLIGAALADSLDNLRAAINLDAGAGTTYALSTTVHPDVSATDTATTVVATAKVGGVAGNAIATTETAANASWGGATLSGGTGGPVVHALGGLRSVN